MLHLAIFFIVLAATIAVCAWVYLSVAKFPDQDEALSCDEAFPYSAGERRWGRGVARNQTSDHLA